MAQQWQITDGSFKGVTFHVATPKKTAQFGMTSQEITWERRLQVSERALVDGATVEDFGRKARTFTAEIIFFGADYRDALATFENLLNPAAPGKGDTGILILPDMRDAVYAKYQKHTRRTQTDSVTILSVSWIEDFVGTVAATTTQTASATAALLAAGNTAQAIPTISDKLLALSDAANSASNALTNNAFVSGLKNLESKIVNSRIALNSILNIPKNLRTTLIGTIARVQNEIATLKQAVQGILHFTDLLNLGLSVGAPTRTNSGAGAIDYITIGTPTTTVVNGVNQVTVTPTVIPTIASFPAAAVKLQASAAVISAAKDALESGSSGNTTDFSDSAIVLLNQIKDMVTILQSQSTTHVVVAAETSLIETIFENGHDVANLDYYRGLNPQLTDILNIPPFTVINL